VVLEAPVQAALDDLDAAFDYCLYGLQAYAVVFSLWPVMRHTYEQLLGRVEVWSGERSATLLGLRERLARSVQSLQATTSLTAEELCVARERVYADMYAQCARGLGSPSAEATLAACLAPGWTSSVRRPQNASACCCGNASVLQALLRRQGSHAW